MLIMDKEIGSGGEQNHFNAGGDYHLRSICIQSQVQGPIPRGRGAARRLTLLSRNKRVSRKMRPAGSMDNVQEEVIFSLAANVG